MKPESILAIEGDAKQCGISKLPQDLKELIFSKLPLESICGYRIICKEWNSILSSFNFLSSLPTQYPWLLICNKEENKNWGYMAYCFSSQKWRTLSLSFLPNPKGGNTRFLPSIGQGLLHFRDLPTSQLFVCNPLMRSYVEIDIDVTDKLMHIVQGGNKEPYLVVFSNSGNFSFQIYQYFQDSWRIKSQFEGEMRSSNILSFEMFECNGVLFLKELSPVRIIIGFKIQNEGFITPVTVAPLPPEMVKDLDFGYFLSIVSYGSSLLVVSVLLNNPGLDIGELGQTQDGIVIWELFQDEENELVWKWKEFLKMPPMSVHEYLGKYWRHQTCACVGDYLCFSSVYGDESVKVFAYNLKERFWQRLPLRKIKNRNTRTRMVSFEPKPHLYQFLRKSRE
ncbi:hypothetical protein SUGI_0956570 [Cryptomeria japonica]|nr:hypothetical protein SUGI_0956570 [Cryptomeria japonica]